MSNLHITDFGISQFLRNTSANDTSNPVYAAKTQAWLLLNIMSDQLSGLPANLTGITLPTCVQEALQADGQSFQEINMSQAVEGVINVNMMVTGLYPNTLVKASAYVLVLQIIDNQNNTITALSNAFQILEHKINRDKTYQAKTINLQLIIINTLPTLGYSPIFSWIMSLNLFSTC